jgi:CO/xanthine dehydrogenase Mo-binding subunit
MAVDVVGASAQKIDGLEKAVGSSRYTTDLTLPRMLVGRALGSIYPNALIKRIDTSRAEAVPGVKAIITADDAPATLEGHLISDFGAIARGQVRFSGEPVAAVAAVDEDAALEALELIEVDYEPLPAVFDAEEALRDGAPLVHPEWESYASAAGMIRGGNLCGRGRIILGDVEKAFDQADFVLEQTFETQIQHQAYLEPIAALVDYDVSGRYTFWMSTKAIYGLQSKIAQLLELPLTSVRCIAPPVGGSFGGKHDITLEVIAALLARKAGRPVKFALTRHEEFTITRPRHGSKITIKSGVTSDGRILGRSVRMLFDTGAYSGTGPGVMSRAATYATGPYAIDNVYVEGLCVYTNKIPAGAFRGYGAPQAHFAFEPHTDALAEKLGMDPLEFRLKNAVGEGSVIAMGERIKSNALADCLKQVADKIGWQQGPTGPNRAIGISSVWKGSGLMTSAAEVRLLKDGSFALEIGAVDVGQGSNTALCQIAAQALGVSLSKVRISQADTDSSPYDWGSASSRVTSTGGLAVQRAALDAREKILQAAAPLLEAAPSDLEIDDDWICVQGAPNRRIPLGAIGGISHFRTGAILGYGTAEVQLHLEQVATLEGLSGIDHQNLTFGAVAAEVEVDPATGEVRPLRIVAASDIGKAINPQLVEAQIEGCVMQGVGYALSEEQVVEDGIVRNTLLNDYLVPMSTTAPTVESIIVEGHDMSAQSGPFGAKGVGEHALLGVAPAIANAVYAATGVRVQQIPLTAERVLNALREQKTGGSEERIP